ncbi:MAG: glycosyltransferase family 4 protein [Candidatus Omnitrophota bacterium]
MRKINLLYVITKLELGGAQKQLLSIISRLDKGRFNLFLFTAKDGLLLEEALAASGLTLERSAFLERAINPLKDILALIEIHRFIKKNNIDIVHTHSSKAGILGRCAARLAGINFIIHTVHGWSFNDYQPNIIRYVFIWLERLTAQFTRKLIVVSHHDKQKGLANCIGGEDKYIIIRYGIDYSEFLKTGQGIREALGINNTALLVCMVSCLKPQKSPLDFVKLVSLVSKVFPDVKFLLVGDGILRKDTQRLIRRLNLKERVILAGWRRDVCRILPQIDIFILTSLWEGLPIAVLEAMAASCPVIVTDTGGIREVIVEGKTGFLIPPGDTNRMLERLSLLIKNGHLRKTIGQEARDSLGSVFCLENMVNKTQELYEDLIKGTGGHGN